MEKLTGFVSEHINDDTTRLIMGKAKWPEIDMDLAVNCIESRRKLKWKVQEWCDEPGLIFPRRLSAEQCSSSATGAYKADIAKAIALQTADQASGSEDFRLADLTGGLGVDSWFFSKRASQVLYCEMLPELCNAARHNFGVLGASNITIKNTAVCNDPHRACQEAGISEDESVFMTPEQILADFQPDVVYMDPARRGEGGKKVFLIEDCTPDVLTLKDEIFRFSRNIFLKLSPMADISMVCERLGRSCREVWVVAYGGECKELLVWMDREWDGDYMIHAVELHKDGSATAFSFAPADEKAASISTNYSAIEAYSQENGQADIYLFEPGKALMKAGAFNLIAERFSLAKLGRSTHYYIFTQTQPEVKEEARCMELKGYGKVFRVIRIDSLDKRSLKAAGKEFPRAEVTARNIPMDTDALRKKIGVTSGDDAHIFGLKSDISGNLLLITTVL